MARKKTDIKIERQQLYRTSQSIESWRRALNIAESTIQPNRTELIRLYKDLQDDQHLLACMNILRREVKKIDFNIVKPSGTIDKQATEYFHNEWYDKLVDVFVNNILFGHTLVQIQEITSDNLSFAIIPHEYVLPEKHLIKTNMYSVDGQDYEPLLKDLFEIGDRFDLGLLAKLAPGLIRIKNAFGFWSEAEEILGFPTIITKTNSQDRKDRETLQNWAKELGRRSTAVVGLEDEIIFESSKSSDITPIHKEIIILIQNLTSKVLLGGVEGIDGGSGGSEARARVHNEKLETIVQSLLKSLGYFINKQVIKKLSAVVNPNCKIEFINSIDKDEELDADLKFQTILNLSGKTIDPNWLSEKYNIPITDGLNTTV